MAVQDYRNLRSDFKQVKLNFHLAYAFDWLFLSTYTSQLLVLSWVENSVQNAALNSQGIEYKKYIYTEES